MKNIHRKEWSQLLRSEYPPVWGEVLQMGLDMLSYPHYWTNMNNSEFKAWQFYCHWYKCLYLSNNQRYTQNQNNPLEVTFKILVVEHTSSLVLFLNLGFNPSQDKLRKVSWLFSWPLNKRGSVILSTRPGGCGGAWAMNNYQQFSVIKIRITSRGHVLLPSPGSDTNNADLSDTVPTHNSVLLSKN